MLGIRFSNSGLSTMYISSRYQEVSFNMSIVSMRFDLCKVDIKPLS